MIFSHHLQAKLKRAVSPILKKMPKNLIVFFDFPRGETEHLNGLYALGWSVFVWENFKRKN
jgi:hypothetical protein